MNKKKEIVPKLRFPEFKNNEFWLYDFLGCLSTVLRGGSPRPIDEYLTSDTNSMNWLKIGDINKEDKYITKTSERVKKQAEEYGHSFERELSYMVVHGFYHLMGYDHIKEEDKKQMRKKEDKILEELGITRE